MNPLEKKILVIGAALVDFKYFPHQKLILGSSNPAEQVKSMGGVGLNMAKNLARLKCNVTMASMIGTDENGVWLRRRIKSLGINDSFLFESETEPTGTYAAVLNENGNLHLGLACTKICDAITPNILEKIFKDINLYEYIIIDTNLPSESLTEIISLMQRTSQKLVINPVSRIKSRKLPKNIAGIHLLVLNEEEAEELFAIGGGDDLKIFHESGLENMVITMGERGLKWYAGNTGRGYLPAKNISALEVKDVSGAGDALTAGIIYGLIHGSTLEKAADFAQKLAAETVKSSKSVLSQDHPFWKTV
ncbi:MAG: carbohydrate kinase family protein [Oligoflexales bacterium]|nr:carbohydrate kinase family protein [Oligoflexales bacterium]